jgi:hypothetical protein
MLVVCSAWFTNTPGKRVGLPGAAQGRSRLVPSANCCFVSCATALLMRTWSDALLPAQDKLQRCRLSATRLHAARLVGSRGVPASRRRDSLCAREVLCGLLVRMRRACAWPHGHGRRVRAAARLRCLGCACCARARAHVCVCVCVCVGVSMGRRSQGCRLCVAGPTRGHCTPCMPLSVREGKATIAVEHMAVMRMCPRFPYTAANNSKRGRARQPAKQHASDARQHSSRGAARTNDAAQQGTKHT